MNTSKEVTLLSDIIEAMGEVYPKNGAPRDLIWSQVIQGIKDMRADCDILMKISCIINGVWMSYTELNHEQDAVEALRLISEALDGG